ncbi:MAG: hypothetical protein AB1578_23530 [Thermodesulfobacteriota bacterium]
MLQTHRICIRFSMIALGVIAAGALLGIPSALAQTHWSIEGTMPSYGESNSPPPLCPLVPPPYLINFPPIPPAGCPVNLPFAPLVGLGGSAVDNDGNVLSGGPATPAFVHSDGFTLEMTSYAGLYIVSGPVPLGYVFPGPISGLGYDSAGDIVWVTDGTMAAGLSMLVPVCPVPAVVVPPFPILSPAGAPQWGLDWDPCTGTLWACDLAGNVSQYAIGGALLFTFNVVPFFPPLLTGLAVNATNGNIQVTDGIMVGEFLPVGVPAPAGPFYLSANPYPIPPWAAPVDGLGFSLRPQNYGTNCNPFGGAGPTIGWGGGYPFAGNGGFTISETGATPGASAILVYGFGYACPGLPVGGCPGGMLWIAPPLRLLGVGLVPGSGTITLPAPIPPPAARPCGFPVGIPLFLQFVNILPGGGGLELTDALSFTIGAI